MTSNSNMSLHKAAVPFGVMLTQHHQGEIGVYFTVKNLPGTHIKFLKAHGLQGGRGTHALGECL